MSFLHIVGLFLSVTSPIWIVGMVFLGVWWVTKHEQRYLEAKGC